MKAYIGAIVLVLSGAMSWVMHYAYIYKAYPMKYQTMDNLMMGMPLPHIIATPLVIYIARKYRRIEEFNILAIMVSLGIFVVSPFVVLLQRSGPMQMMSFFLGLGVYAAALLVLPLLCVLTYFTTKERSYGNPRGFPIDPISPQDGGK